MLSKCFPGRVTYTLIVVVFPFLINPNITGKHC